MVILLWHPASFSEIMTSPLEQLLVIYIIYIISCKTPKHQPSTHLDYMTIYIIYISSCFPWNIQYLTVSSSSSSSILFLCPLCLYPWNSRSRRCFFSSFQSSDRYELIVWRTQSIRWKNHVKTNHLPHPAGGSGPKGPRGPRWIHQLPSCIFFEISGATATLELGLLTLKVTWPAKRGKNSTFNHILPGSGWLNHPIEKMLVKLHHFPR